MDVLANDRTTGASLVTPVLGNEGAPENDRDRSDRDGCDSKGALHGSPGPVKEPLPIRVLTYPTSDRQGMTAERAVAWASTVTPWPAPGVTTFAIGSRTLATS